MALQDSTRTSRLHFMTLRGLLYNTRWLAEDDSTRVTRRGDVSKRTTQRGWLDEGMTRRGRLNEGDSTRGWLEEDDSTRVTRRGMTRRGRLNEGDSTRQDDSTRLLRVVCEGHLFCELCWRFFFFSIIWNVQSIIMTFMANPLFLLL